MPKERVPPLPSVVLTALRRARGWTSQKLAGKVGISAVKFSLYENERAPSPEKLRVFAEALDYDADAPDFVLAGLTQAVGAPELPGSPCDPSPQERKAARRVAVQVGLAATETVERTLVDRLRRRNARRDRRKAVVLVRRLEAEPPEKRLQRLESEPALQTWAIAERLCYRSTDAASDRAELALDLAGLAHRCAKLAPGEELWRTRLEGFALFFVANARRVANKAGAEEAFTQGMELWEAGAPADPAGLLPEWRRFDLEGSLRRDQRRFPEALAALARARTVAPCEAVGHILLNKAFTLEQMGEVERAVEVLREAGSLVDGRGNPRLPWVLDFNRATALSQLGRFAEGEELLPKLRELAIASRKDLDLLRVVWLGAKIANGLGRKEEALAGFEQVQRKLIGCEMACDCALVTLELAVLLLEQGCHAEVKKLAAESGYILRAHGIRREALAAFQVFRMAADREELTLELARQLLSDMERALKDPDQPLDL